MGNLSKQLVIGGHRFHREWFRGEEEDALRGSYIWDVLRQEGVDSYVPQILEGSEPLSIPQIVHLMLRCSLPTLMKLSALGTLSGRLSPPSSVKLLMPRHSSVSTELQQIDSHSLVVVHESAKWWRNAQVIDRLQAVREAKPGVLFVGPRMEEALRGLPKKQSTATASFHEVQDLIAEFAQVGVARFRATRSLTLSQLLNQCKAPATYTLCIDKFRTPLDLARSLHDLSCLELDSTVPFVWEVGVEHWKSSLRSDPALNLLLLRVLAIGSIVCMRKAVDSRASSRFFSKESLSLAPYFGATQLGPGAVDDFTASNLGFLGIDQLKPLYESSRFALG